MRGLLVIPAAVVVTAAVGVTVCKFAGWHVSVAPVLIAAVTCAAAGMLGLVPMMLSRGSSQGAVAQAGLVGTLVHLFVAIIVAAVVLLAKLDVGNGFVYWLLAFYWTTLAVLAIEIARTVRRADPTGANAKHP